MRQEVTFMDRMYEVNLKKIDRSLFLDAREDERQESARLFINEAFAEIDKQEGRYSKPFFILTPEKEWSCAKKVTELQEYAKTVGGHMADWIELALAWAQKISRDINYWKKICNDYDAAFWYRMIIWKDGNFRIFGGASKRRYYVPESEVYSHIYLADSWVDCVVPLIAINKK